MGDETVVTVRWETGARDYALPLQVPIRDWLPLLRRNAGPLPLPGVLRRLGRLPAHAHRTGKGVRP